MGGSTKQGFLRKLSVRVDFQGSYGPEKRKMFQPEDRFGTFVPPVGLEPTL